ncbi:claspin [Protopterus annectens]|uniref:claspin n=1 Tax=Protopterus annectens TaxID=7888 RepID=UPI001CF9AAF2|nr:claspin [Protopterus annectens]
MLADSDLFETEVADEMELEEEEESLESIRAAVKNKAKQHKSRELIPTAADQEYLSDDENEGTTKKTPERKERKAARISKEAMKQLHSETQRIVRESSLSLPYHLPEPKSIHDFFRRRPRPTCQGSAMNLLKSTKYQPTVLEENAASLPGSGKDDCHLQSDQPSVAENLLVESTLTKGQVAAVSESAAAPCEELREESVELTDSNVDGNDERKEQIPESGNDERKEQIPESENSDDMLVLRLDSNSCSVEQTMDTAVGGSSAEMVSEIADISTDRNKIEVTNNLLETNTGREKPHDQIEKSEVILPVKQKKSKFDKLRELGVDLSLKPRLNPDEGSFINLEEPKVNNELEALKARFLKHTFHTAKPKTSRVVHLNVVRKETNADGKEELKADSVPVTLCSDEFEATSSRPGEKFQLLRAKLWEAMKLRRSEERQKRRTLLEMDNEEGFEEEEEEEEEMTDESGAEDGEDDAEEVKENVEDLLGANENDSEADEECDEVKSVSEKENEISSEDVVTSRPHISESTLLLFKDSLSKTEDKTDDSANKADNKSDDDSSVTSLGRTENSHNSSFELMGSMITSYQPFSKQAGRGAVSSSVGRFRSPSPGLFKVSFVSSASKSSGKLSEPSMPVEDSQDLYSASPEHKNSVLVPGESQFRFSLEEDTHSQLLDADGFLNVGPRSTKYQQAECRLTLDSLDENAMDANMDELLNLCTGQFKTQLEKNEKPCEKKKDSKNMDELLALCSGKFVSQESTSQVSSDSSKQQQLTQQDREGTTDTDDPMAEALALCSGSFPTDREEDEEDEEVDGEFQLVTDDEAFNSDEEDDESAENEEDETEDNRNFDSDDEQLLVKKMGNKRKLRMDDFLEEEAELSGSDVGSDDDDDGGENEYEEEEIDEELPSDEELQDQVNKIHMKALLDDDKRQLRLYQERYLEDGDLHNDGPGRMRKFRWKNIDDASQIDLFRGDSDNEQCEEELDETEVKWRKERFEREQWLREQSQTGTVAKDEDEEDIGKDSQFMKLAKKATVKALQKKVVLGGTQQEKKIVKNPFETLKLSTQVKNGSLLNRPKEMLQKLAAISDLNPNAARNSRNFVFHTVSPEKKQPAEEKKQVRKKSVAANAAAVMPAHKRPRIEKASINGNRGRSIFSYLEN